jgi:hypothetical protein
MDVSVVVGWSGCLHPDHGKVGTLRSRLSGLGYYTQDWRRMNSWGKDFSELITTVALSWPMTLKGKELMVGIGSLLANMLLVVPWQWSFHSSWEPYSKVLTTIFMIGFVIHGPYTDGAYAYSTLTPENYSGTVTTWHWLYGAYQSRQWGTRSHTSESGPWTTWGLQNSCLFQHEQIGISFDEIFRRGTFSRTATF